MKARQAIRGYGSSCTSDSRSGRGVTGVEEAGRLRMIAVEYGSILIGSVFQSVQQGDQSFLSTPQEA